MKSIHGDSSSASVSEPRVSGKCARCKAPVMIEPLTIMLAKKFNTVLKARGEKLLDRNDTALCDNCYPAWQEERRQFAKAKMDREQAALNVFKQTYKQYGEGMAFREIPQEFRNDFTFKKLAEDWIVWWKTKGEKKEKKGQDY